MLMPQALYLNGNYALIFQEYKRWTLALVQSKAVLTTSWPELLFPGVEQDFLQLNTVQIAH